MPARNALDNPKWISSRLRGEPERRRANLGKVGEIQPARKVQPALSAFQLDENALGRKNIRFRWALNGCPRRRYSVSVVDSGMLIPCPPALPFPPRSSPWRLPASPP